MGNSRAFSWSARATILLLGAALWPAGTRADDLYLPGSRDVTKITAAGYMSTVVLDDSKPGALAVDAAGDLLIAERVTGNVTRLDLARFKAYAQHLDNYLSQDYLHAFAASPADREEVFSSLHPMWEKNVLEVGTKWGVYPANLPPGTTSWDIAGVDFAFATDLKSPDRYPTGMVVDSQGNVYVAEAADAVAQKPGNSRPPVGRDPPKGQVVKVSTNGNVTVLDMKLYEPTGLALDAGDNLYVADHGEDAIYRADKTGKVTVFTRGVSTPHSLTFDPEDNLLVTSTGKESIFTVDPKGGVRIFATGLTKPTALAFDSNGSLFVASQDDVIYQVTAAGKVSTFAKEVEPRWNMVFDPGLRRAGHSSMSLIQEIILFGAAGTFVLLAATFWWCAERKTP